MRKEVQKAADQHMEMLSHCKAYYKAYCKACGKRFENENSFEDGENPQACVYPILRGPNKALELEDPPRHQGPLPFLQGKLHIR